MNRTRYLDADATFLVEDESAKVYLMPSGGLALVTFTEDVITIEPIPDLQALSIEHRDLVARTGALLRLLELGSE